LYLEKLIKKASAGGLNYMEKHKIDPELFTENVPATFTPSQEQINAIARIMMPELKMFFTDEQVQQEFVEWQKRESTGGE